MSFVFKKTVKKSNSASGSPTKLALSSSGDVPTKKNEKTNKQYKSANDLNNTKSSSSSDFSELNSMEEGSDMSADSSYGSPTLGREGPDRKKQLAMVFTLICDTSGSMPTNGKMDYVNHGFTLLFDQVLRDRDFVQYYTFSSCHTFKHFARSKHNLTSAKINSKPCSMGGGTPLWDSIELSLKELPTVKNWMQKEFVIITNGPDNCSKSSLTAITQILQQAELQHAHITFLNIGEESKETQQIKAFCHEKPTTSSFFSCDGSKGGVADLFKKMQDGVTSRRAVNVQPARKKEPKQQKKLKRILEI